MGEDRARNMVTRSVVTLCLLAISVSADLIVQKPLSGKSGAEKLLIIINGAYVPNTDYAELGQKIQEASPLKLWVAIPSFILNCPNPGEIGSKITGAVSEVKSEGFSGIEPSTDVFISGHSLGGIFSQTVVAKGGYAGLVLFGSYLTKTFKNNLKDFKYPVLTLGGELDGLTHITRIATEFKNMESRISKDGHDALYKFPVVVLPGQSHSQFCSNVNVTSFGNKDLMPEVSWEVAHEAISVAVNHFFTLVLSPKDATARSYIDAKYKYGKDLLAGWFSAQSDEPSWCSAAQKLNAANVSSSFKTKTTTCTNVVTFDAEYPSVDGGSQLVSVVERADYVLNPTDSSLDDISATEIDCKILTEKSIMDAFGEKGKSISDQGCKAANEAALQRAYSLVPAVTKDRYHRLGKPFDIQDDVAYSTGITWEHATFGFAPGSSSVKVQSPILTTGETVLCKLASPARFVEYMMTDGLPRFDGSVP